MKINPVVIVAATRTPIGSFMGSLSNIPAPQLGAIAIKGALEKINLNPELIEEVFMGNVLSAGLGQAPARQAALGAGISVATPCTTINKVCASGLKSVMLAAQSIQVGTNEIVVAGGMENMSLVPHYHWMRNGQKYGSVTLADGIQKDGLTDAYNQKAMGVCGDLCAEKYQITREQQDQYAIDSYQKAHQAWQNGNFRTEITPVPIPQRNEDPIYVTEDEEYKNIKADKVAGLKPAFTPEGTVTAANASKLSDGAAALILMSEKKAQELGLQPLAYINSYADAAQEPEWFTTTPALAVQKALQQTNLILDEIDYFEFNEAFSVVSLANAQILGIPQNKLNIYGGAVSLGHPLGCSGARILVTLLNVLQQNQAKYGIASICNGGGGASAMIIERV